MGSQETRPLVFLGSIFVEVAAFAIFLIALLLGFLLNPYLFILLLAIPVLAAMPLEPRRSSGLVVGIILVPLVLVVVLAIVLGFVYHPYFFLLLLSTAVLIVPVRLHSRTAVRR